MTRGAIGHVVVAALVGWLGAAAALHAGAFSGSDSDLFGRDAIVHAKGYDGTGGDLVLTVCLDSEAPDEAELPLELVIATWNARQATTANIAAGAVGGTALDFQTWALHGLGLCLGLDDPADELGFAAATAGTNAVLDRDAGTDTVAGTRDDVRGDDENRMWFRIVDNDPFTASGDAIDPTTFSRNTAVLPEGENFATAPTRGVAIAESVPGSEAVMVAASPPGEAKRSLLWDDIATRRIAEAGVDGSEGTADDYSVLLTYVGRTDTCDVPTTFGDQAEVVACVTGKGSLGGSHFRINFTALGFAEAVNWAFDAGDALMIDGFESGNTDGWTSQQP